MASGSRKGGKGGSGRNGAGRGSRDAACPGGSYEVGRGKPPKDKQWKPGFCPNPSGRPKGSKNIKTIVQASVRKTVPVVRNGRRTKMQFNELGMHNLQEEIKGGSRSAFKDFLDIQDRYLGEEIVQSSMKQLLSEDQAIVAYMLTRQRATKGNQDE